MKTLTFSKIADAWLGLITILFANCSKQNHDAASGYWTISDNKNKFSYNINYTSRQDSLGYSVLKGSDKLPSVSGATVNSIYIWFAPPLPVTNGLYEMVDFQSTSKPLTASQIGISGFLPADPYKICSMNNAANFNATGIASMDSWPWPLSGNASLTVSNGKIRVAIPQTTTQYSDGCGLDSPYLNLIFQEK